MKQHFKFSVLIAAACLVGTLAPAPATEQKPLQPLAETICGLGTPFPTSRLFELFELEVPFLILTEGPEMMAASAVQCRDFRPTEGEPFFMVLGHRNKQGTATFFVTSLQGELIQASRGIMEASGDLTFKTIVQNNEVIAEFEAAKTFWLTTCINEAFD